MPPAVGMAVELFDLSAVPVLETERLRLRRIAERDLDELALIYSDPAVMRFIGGATLDRQKTWLAIAGMLGHWALRGYGLFAVEDRASSAFMGRVGIIFPEGWPEMEIAWALGRRWWGRGFATEAARAARDWGFAVLGMPRLISLVHPENHPSRRVAVKLGARLDRRIVFQGQPCDVYVVDNPQCVAVEPLWQGVKNR